MGEEVDLLRRLEVPRSLSEALADSAVKLLRGQAHAIGDHKSVGAQSGQPVLGRKSERPGHEQSFALGHVRQDGAMVPAAACWRREPSWALSGRDKRVLVVSTMEGKQPDM